MPRRLLGALLLLCACLPCAPAWAQTVNNTTSLSFGSFTAGIGGGTLTVNTGSGRSSTGSVLLVNQGGSASAAQFLITGTANATFAITLPADGTVLLSDGSSTMALNGFTSNPSGTGTLSGGGNLSVSIGATLAVSPSQGTGSYSGSFSISIDYN